MAETIPASPLNLSGPVILSTLDEVRARLDRAAAGAPVDLSAVNRLDTAGAWLLGSTGRPVTGADEAQSLLMRKVQDAMPVVDESAARARWRATDMLAGVGLAVQGFIAATAHSLGFVGLVMARLAATLAKPRRLRLTAMVHHMQAVGLNAVPIVALMGFLVGVVLAFQGAAQLRQFGAEVFVVDLIAVSILRELGILLTAIIVAGRSASAFTAAIGSMKMREEIDAMRVLGLDPIELLVLPRLLALMIMLPILGLVADLSGLFGGGLMAWVELGISPSQFRTQLLADVDATQALVGLSKAPVFAAIIALVGCQQGLMVKGDAESLGMRTSRAVVIAIFLVIVVDALFSVFFAVWGV
ncbi:MlaE family ABC transporter permease [Rhodovulum euryhalinum]|uniref:Phospholipid/cholesterol/gamma-HCH transport system permease protein n=1 Tax=Rhodovulum euryhalinum TaxID=35805 RepID=A0A4R2KGM6_9RHOB|nr:ABC transporter permease [Rhodovulum euryhalinum]TCO69128.1 phospholipid/cholesterol/gamma-HCH transport system permease protein [Rhodovulum euryhalinum]